MTRKTKRKFIKNLTEHEIEELEYLMLPFDMTNDSDPRWDRCHPPNNGFSWANICSMNGFLASGDSLKEVIESDSKSLREHKITYKQIADGLESIMGQVVRMWDLSIKPSDELGYPIEFNEDVYHVKTKMYLGSQLCPFSILRESGFCGGASTDFEITNSEGEKQEFSGLMPHLIKDHHFFEGKVPYRVNPFDVIDFLELKPGVNYTPKRKTEQIWEYVNSDENLRGSKKFISEAEKQINARLNGTFYKRGDILEKNGKNCRQSTTMHIKNNRALLIMNGDFDGKIVMDKPRMIDGAYLSGIFFEPQTKLKKVKKRYIVG